MDVIIASGMLTSYVPGPRLAEKADYPLTVYALRATLLELLGDLDGALLASAAVVQMFSPPRTDDQRRVVATCVGIQANIYMHRGAVQSAQDALEDVLQRSEGDDDETVLPIRIAALVSLASILEEAGNVSRARNLYREALDLEDACERSEKPPGAKDHWMARNNTERLDRALTKARRRARALSAPGDDAQGPATN